MPYNDPVDSKILNLLSTDLPSEGSIRHSTTILSTDLNVRIEHSLGRWDMDDHGSDHHFYPVLIELHFVEHFVDHVPHELDGAVALPVTAN